MSDFRVKFKLLIVEYSEDIVHSTHIVFIFYIVHFCLFRNDPTSSKKKKDKKILLQSKFQTTSLFEGCPYFCQR